MEETITESERAVCIVDRKQKWLIYSFAFVPLILLLLGVYAISVYSMSPVLTGIVIVIIIGSGFISLVAMISFFKSRVSAEN